MEKRKTDTRWGKIAWIVACCALGLLVVKVGVEVWLGSKIRRTIVSKVSEASDGAYWAEVGGVKVGLFNRAVRVENFTLHSDSARLRLKGSPLAGLNVRVAQLSLGGIRWDRKGASMRISADDLEIISPRIVLSRSPDAEADTSGRFAQVMARPARFDGDLGRDRTFRYPERPGRGVRLPERPGESAIASRG